MPILGMPTLIEKPTLTESCELCHDLGLSFVELNMNLPEFSDISAIDKGELCAAQEKYGIFFTLHLDERMDLCDFNPLIRNAYLETLRRALDLALETNMPVLNMHFSKGVYFTLPERRVHLYQQERASVEKALDAAKTLVARTVGNGHVKVCIENTEGISPFVAGDVEFLLSDPHFALTLDVGHCHAAPERADYEAFYAKNEAHLRHIHLHDAKGAKNHLPLGTGDLDWRSILTLADARSCTTVIEVKTVSALTDSVRLLQKL